LSSINTSGEKEEAKVQNYAYIVRFWIIIISDEDIGDLRNPFLMDGHTGWQIQNGYDAPIPTWPHQIALTAVMYMQQVIQADDLHVF
jgi:hypothetical protein